MSFVTAFVVSNSPEIETIPVVHVAPWLCLRFSKHRF